MVRINGETFTIRERPFTRSDLCRARPAVLEIEGHVFELDLFEIREGRNLDVEIAHVPGDEDALLDALADYLVACLRRPERSGASPGSITACDAP